MDVSGKVVYARNAEILTATLQAAGASLAVGWELFLSGTDWTLPDS